MIRGVWQAVHRVVDGLFVFQQDAEKVRQQGVWPSESPVLAQRAVSEEQKRSSQTILLARRTRTMERCSSDARSEGQSGCSP